MKQYEIDFVTNIAKKYNLDFEVVKSVYQECLCSFEYTIERIEYEKSNSYSDMVNFSQTESAKEYGLTLNDVDFELVYPSNLTHKHTLLIIPNDDEYPIEALEFESEDEMKQCHVVLVGAI